MNFGQPVYEVCAVSTDSMNKSANLSLNSTQLDLSKCCNSFDSRFGTGDPANKKPGRLVGFSILTRLVVESL